jgi:hypothetical protein
MGLLGETLVGRRRRRRRRRVFKHRMKVAFYRAFYATLFRGH